MSHAVFKIGSIALVAALLPGLSACGFYSGTYRRPSGNTTWVAPGTDDDDVPVTNPATGDEEEEEDAGTGLPPYEFTVRGVGYNTTYVDVRVNRVLKVRFIPGQQDRQVAGTGFTPNYSRLWAYIRVGQASQPTPALSNGFTGGDAQASHVMDFSGAYTRTCSASNLSCRQTVRVYVQQPNNDYFCLNFGMYCPGAHVWDTHPWNGTLLIQTDDTDPV